MKPANPVSRVRVSSVCAVSLVIGVVALLALPMRLPLGSFYWDVDLYLGAAHRFAQGQLPHVDYFSQVGSLSLALFAGGASLFPRAHPLLLSHCSILIITLPLFIALMRELETRSVATTVVICVPFVILSVLPYNNNNYFISPAPDGSGIYNRQNGILLYTILVSVLWSKSTFLQTVVCSVAMSAIIFTKITGVAPALLFIGYGIFVGRVRPVVLAASLGFVAFVAATLQIRYGIVGAYIADLARLASMSSGTLERVVIFCGGRVDTIAIFCAIAVLCWHREKCRRSDALSKSTRRQFVAGDTAWIAVCVAAAVAYEAENHGSVELAYLWPLWVRVLFREWHSRSVASYAIVLLILIANAPIVLDAAQRSARALVQSVKLVALPVTHLDNIGQVTLTVAYLERARVLLEHYAKHRAAYSELADRGEMPSRDLFANIDFQALYLLSVEEAVIAVRALETSRQRPLGSSYTLDFVDPVSRIVGTTPPRRVSIASDTGRTIPVIDESVIDEVAAVSAIFEPLCPITPERQAIKSLFRPALAGRRPVEISPCWTLWLRDEAGQGAAAKP